MMVNEKEDKGACPASPVTALAPPSGVKPQERLEQSRSSTGARRWSHEEAVALCRSIEAICPKFGCHVALTGGTLYKEGLRKDADILFYRIRQVDEIDEAGLFAALAKLGIERTCGFGWCIKAKFDGKSIDCFFPEEAGEYESEDEGGTGAARHSAAHRLPAVMLHTLASDIASAITLASRSIPHVDRIDRRRLMDARDRLDRFHAALLADMKRIVDGPFGTVGCWQTRESGIRDIIGDVERIVAANRTNRRAA